MPAAADLNHFEVTKIFSYPKHVRDARWPVRPRKYFRMKSVRAHVVAE
jgi:hypothetical protein